jgi:glycosyltransferase involved in cell wall biosynthesis
VHEATLFPFQSPLLHYTFNAPHHFRVIDRIIREEDIDIVVGAHVLAGAAMVRAAERHNVPVIFDLKDWFPDSAAAYYSNRLLKEAIRSTVWKITAWNLSHSTRVTTVSPSLVRKLDGFGFSAGLITNGVNTDLFYPRNTEVCKRELGLDPECFVIGFAGSVERWYAIDQLIRMLPEIRSFCPEVHLLIVGGSLFTDYSNELKALVASLGLAGHVTFTGGKRYDELPLYMNAMDVCTIPLSPPQWVEIALPNKFFEYSACSRPILSTPIPDVEAIGGPHLHIYQSTEEFISHIRRIYQERMEYRIDFSQFSWKRKAAEFEGVIEEVLCSGRGK